MHDGVCSECGYIIADADERNHALPAGTILSERYFVGNVLGEGGFGITYIGFDTRLDIRVAIKEYYPTAFASREVSATTHSVYSYSGEKGDFFKRGLDRFMKEAKSLTRFSREPAVVSVTDFFHENGTAYIVMEFVEGDSLKTVLKKHGRIGEESALILMTPMIKALAKMHKAGIIHRDIAPDNIMIEPDGTARLIDFGSAMEATGDNKSTVAMIKHGFAPEEQHDSNHSRQGSWTDVYSICATLYAVIEGETPTDALDRLRGEELKDFTAPVSETTKKAIMKGLEILPKNRIQTMDELLSMLEGEAEIVEEEQTEDEILPVAEPEKVTHKPVNIRIISAIAAAIMICIAIPIIISMYNNRIIFDEDFKKAVFANGYYNPDYFDNTDKYAEITSLAVSGQDLTSLNGIEYFTSLTSLSCNENELTSLPDLPDSLLALNCSDNNLTSLPELPDSMVSLLCHNNNLTSLPELPDSLTWLDCYGNNLASLPEMPNSLTRLWCDTSNVYAIRFKDGSTALERQKAGTIEITLF
jgi:serine/threonine protein kinase